MKTEEKGWRGVCHERVLGALEGADVNWSSENQERSTSVGGPGNGQGTGVGDGR